ncbi:hypothetical protein [Paracoccus alcaliphilus]|uniref:hypothetical protein n=1 Tax=Paracoccus alcaliphilus TaxID=34002 RepID=UPI001FCD5121|nr:hypothetical protein [Paracoccus alcaliphilus]
MHVAVYDASHNVVLLQIMRALSGMLREGVFHNREKLYARSEMRDGRDRRCRSPAEISLRWNEGGNIAQRS